MNVLSLPRPDFARASAPPAATTPSAPTPPSPPDIDFTTVDTPQKAALLPNLAVGAFTINQTQVLGAVASHLDMKSTLKMTAGQSTPINLQYAFDDKSLKMQVTGQAGAAPVNETWTVDPDALTITIAGTVGKTPENLVYSQNDDGNMHLDGTVGTMAVHEIYNVVSDGLSKTDGTIGDQATHQTLTIVQPDPKGPSTVHVEGTVGDGAIKTDETVTSSSNLAIEFAGPGSILGTPVQIDQGYIWSQPAASP